MGECWYRIRSLRGEHQVVEVCRYRMKNDGEKNMGQSFTDFDEAKRYKLWLEGWSLEEIDAGVAV